MITTSHERMNPCEQQQQPYHYPNQYPSWEFPPHYPPHLMVSLSTTHLAAYWYRPSTDSRCASCNFPNSTRPACFPPTVPPTHDWLPAAVSFTTASNSTASGFSQQCRPNGFCQVPPQRPHNSTRPARLLQHYPQAASPGDRPRGLTTVPPQRTSNSAAPAWPHNSTHAT